MRSNLLFLPAVLLKRLKMKKEKSYEKRRRTGGP